jgi:hypothetical protein
MKRTLSRASLVSVVGVWAACSPIQTVSYPVREPDGRTVNVDKYFSSLSTDDPGDRSFKQIQAGRIDEALATMKAAEASSPTDASFHYDLAIIYEIKADWPSALSEIRDAKRLSPTDKMYSDEEAFIARHSGK